MWIASLTFILFIWLALTALSLWWMISMESGWVRIAWAACMLLVPGLGAMLWLAYGKQRSARTGIDTDHRSS